MPPLSPTLSPTQAGGKEDSHDDSLESLSNQINPVASGLALCCNPQLGLRMSPFPPACAATRSVARERVGDRGASSPHFHLKPILNIHYLLALLLLASLIAACQPQARPSPDGVIEYGQTVHGQL